MQEGQISQGLPQTVRRRFRLQQQLLFFRENLFPLENVQPGAAQNPLVQCPDQRSGIDQFAPCRIDQQGPALKLVDIMRPDQMVRRRACRSMEGDDVRSAQQVFEADVGEMEMLGFGPVLDGVIGQEMHPKCSGDLHDILTDMADPDHSQRFTLEVESLQSLQREVAGDGADIRLVQIAGQGEDQRKCMLGDGVFAVSRHVADRQSALSGLRDGDVIVTGRARGDQFQVRQRIHDLRIQA